MKGTKWMDSTDGKEYTYESQGTYLGWNKFDKVVEKVGVVILSTVLAEGMSVVIPTILFLKNFKPVPAEVPKKDKSVTTH